MARRDPAGAEAAERTSGHAHNNVGVQRRSLRCLRDNDAEPAAASDVFFSQVLRTWPLGSATAPLAAGLWGELRGDAGLEARACYIFKPVGNCAIQAWGHGSCRLCNTKCESGEVRAKLHRVALGVTRVLGPRNLAFGTKGATCIALITVFHSF